MRFCSFHIKGVAISSYVLFFTDILLVVFSVLLAYLVRFNFSIPASELKPLPIIILYIVGVRAVFLLLSRSYSTNLTYLNFMDVLRVYFFTILGSFFLLLSDVVIYYFFTQLLFIPLTIIILEFLCTSFFIILTRGLIRISYSSMKDKGKIEKLDRRD